MDITQLSSSISQANTTNAFGVAMLSKSLDTTEQIGNSLVSMIDKSTMEQSVTPYLGGNLDLSI